MERLKILVVDDENRMRKLIRDFLVKSGYEVLEAEDGEKAVDTFMLVKDISLIILDVMMPKMDGITVVQTLRRQGNSIPVIMLTAKSEIDDKVLGLDSGANDYMTKPFDTKELLARIRVLTRGQHFADTRMMFGNVSLDRATFTLSSPIGSFRLANKEFQMMEILMSNPRNLISSERFMEKVWGYETDAEINVVWVYISYLRKKLTALGANVQIRSSRNAGYTLEEIA